ncbi:hypothetical protein ILYODFUR_011337 [Ilyodon furcidens]|uniref:Uncharacterized protein n=1 Tax=Ilyodon furcidens TaxID=33524 RepID=A0ABV0TIY9_9TELE
MFSPIRDSRSMFSSHHCLLFITISCLYLDCSVFFRIHLQACQWEEQASLRLPVSAHQIVLATTLRTRLQAEENQCSCITGCVKVTNLSLELTDTHLKQL